MPEAYHQQFRKLRRSEGQTYVELVHELSIRFNRWVTASEVESMDDLKESALLQQLKDILPECVTTYLNKHQVKTVTEAAVLAGEYTLTHKTYAGGRNDWRRRDYLSIGHQAKVGGEVESPMLRSSHGWGI